MVPFRSVALAGKGQLGSFIVAELLSSGFQVTILTRSKESIKHAPSNARIAEVDYSSVSKLTTVLQGHDVLIATLAMDALSVQRNLLAAAMHAGVKRFIPSEYSGITLNPQTAELPFLAPVMEIQRLVKEEAAEGSIEYTILCPGGFLNLVLNQPVLLDWDNHIAHLYDGGEIKLSVSRLSTIAKAISAILGDSSKYKNAMVRFHDGFVTQRRPLDIAKRIKPEIEWKEVTLESEQAIKDGLKKVEDGSATAETAGAMMLASTFAATTHFCWTEEELENNALGLKEMTEKEIDELIEARAKGKLFDVANDYDGPWKVDIK